LTPATCRAAQYLAVKSQKEADAMFEALESATKLAAWVLASLVQVPVAYKDLADQARRSITSVPLNLAEGAGRIGNDRTHHYRIAYGSAREATVAIQLLAAVGVIAPADHAAIDGQLDRVRAMTWRLARH
jgi:four helix bundle protein